MNSRVFVRDDQAKEFYEGVVRNGERGSGVSPSLYIWRHPFLPLHSPQVVSRRDDGSQVTVQDEKHDKARLLPAIEVLTEVSKQRADNDFALLRLVGSVAPHTVSSPPRDPFPPVTANLCHLCPRPPRGSKSRPFYRSSSVSAQMSRTTAGASSS